MALLRVRKGSQPGAAYPVFSSRQPTILGREGRIDIALGDAKASRRHACVYLEHGEWILQDLQSSNGTFLQGKRVGKTRISDGASIQVGGTLLSFHEAERPAPPSCEIHGTRPLESLREESGVFVFRARQAAMDREVRCDWLHPSRDASERLVESLEQAFEESQKLSDSGILPVIQAGMGDDGTFVLLRPLFATLAERIDEVLRLPLASRIEVFRQLVDTALERATWEALRFPVSLVQVGIELPSGGTAAGEPPRVFLPALDLGAFVAAGLGDLAHIPHYAPYLPPEMCVTDAAPATRARPPLSGPMYNLGALGYHLLTGQQAMGDGSVLATLESHKTLRPAPAALLDANIPEPLSTMLERMLEKDPVKRPGGRQEVLGAFPPAPGAFASLPAQAPAAAQPPAVRLVSPRRPASPARAAPAAEKSGPARRETASRSSPASPPSSVRTAQREAQRKTIPAAAARGRVPALLYLPLWAMAWVGFFFAARYLSKMVFQSLGG